MLFELCQSVTFVLKPWSSTLVDVIKCLPDDVSLRLKHTGKKTIKESKYHI